MSKAKIVKDKKEKKRFPWSKIWYYFKSLFNNSIAMECGMKTKWYVTIFVFIISIMISIIPTTVLASQTSGSSYIDNTYNDTFVYGLYDYYNNSTIDIKFDNNEAKLTVEDSSRDISKPIYVYKYTSGNTSINNDTPRLEIYYVPEDSNNYETTLNDIIYSDSANPVKKEGDSYVNQRKSSYIIFTNHHFYSGLYILTASSVTKSLSGDFYNLRSSFNGLTFKELLNIDRNEISGTDSYSLSQKYILNYYDLAHDVYITQRTNYTWVTFGITCGLNAGITLLMGFVVWLLTRGKNNPLKYTLKWYHGFGITSWLSMTPALLTLIFGFMLGSTYSMIIYILLFGLRCMWLSMRNLRPQTN